MLRSYRLYIYIYIELVLEILKTPTSMPNNSGGLKVKRVRYALLYYKDTEDKKTTSNSPLALVLSIPNTTNSDVL